MKIYSLPECEPCQKIKEWVKERSINIEISELKKIDDVWHEKTDQGFIKFDESIKSFPALLVGEQGETRTYIIGDEGIKSYLEKGYNFESKICPHLNKACIEKECAKFTIMSKGPLLEGGCSDYWTSIILTELLVKGK